MARKNSLRAAAWFLIFAVFLVFAAPVFRPEVLSHVHAAGKAGRSSRTVRVGYAQLRDFMEGDSDDSVRSGYAYEYMQTVSYYTGWKYEYVYGDWYTLLKKLEKGEIDMLAGVSQEKEYSGKILFPDDPMGSEDFYIYMKKGTTGSADDDPGELKGISIGINSASAMTDELEKFNRQNGLGMNIVKYRNNAECIHDYYHGKLDAVAATEISVPVKDDSVPVANIGSAEYYMAVSASRQDLLDELNGSLSRLSSSDPDFPQMLWQKYLGNTGASSKFTQKEKEWLQNHKVITAGYSDGYAPFCSKDKNGQTQGVFPDLLRNIFSGRKPKVSVRFKAYQSYEKMVDDLKNGKLDMIMPILDQAYFAEENGIYITGDAVEIHMQMVYRGRFDEARKGKLAVTRRNQSQNYYTRYNYQNNRILQVDNLQSGLEAVRKGNADAMIINSYAANILLRNEGGFRTMPLVQSAGLCIGVRRNNSTLVSILNRGITRYGQEKIETSLVRNIEKASRFTFSSFVRQHYMAVIVVGILAAVILFVIISTVLYRIRERHLLDRMAHMDSTTSLKNRRAYEETIEKLRKSMPEDTIVVEADINGLKQVNDNLGHEAGDELIRGAAECLEKSFGTGSEDDIFRIGGDEFSVIFSADPDEAAEKLESFRKSASRWKGPKCGRLYVSTGIAAAADHPGYGIDDLIREADREMYKNKKKYYQQPGHSRRRN